jgi:hypothetical protein
MITKRIYYHLSSTAEDTQTEGEDKCNQENMGRNKSH